jgi:hypothetical protein
MSPLNKDNAKFQTELSTRSALYAIQNLEAVTKLLRARFDGQQFYDYGPLIDALHCSARTVEREFVRLQILK